jgi:undecaprenyl-diphosphatase
LSIQSLETQLLLLINHGTANGLFDILMPALTKNGYLMIIPYLIGILVWGSRNKNDQGRSYLPIALWTILIAVCSIYLTGYVEETLKVAVGRTRPCRAIEGIRLIIACPSSFSLPSGHAITSFGVALPLFYLTKGYVSTAWRLYPLFLASAIAFSRLYLGVHYPTDVLVGAVLGGGIGLGLAVLYQMGNKIWRKKMYGKGTKNAQV